MLHTIDFLPLLRQSVLRGTWIFLVEASKTRNIYFFLKNVVSLGILLVFTFFNDLSKQPRSISISPSLIFILLSSPTQSATHLGRPTALLAPLPLQTRCSGLFPILAFEHVHHGILVTT